MKKATLAIRILLGLAFVVFGVNFWASFMKTPPPNTEVAGQFTGALYTTGALAVIKALEVLGGAALLSGRFAPLGLVILGPILVVIVLWDIFMNKAFNPASTGLMAMWVFLMIRYRDNWRGIFSAPRA